VGVLRTVALRPLEGRVPQELNNEVFNNLPSDLQTMVAVSGSFYEDKPLYDAAVQRIRAAALP
jgi:hypothetical protein